MKFCFVPGGLPIMGRIEKEKGARILGYILLLLGVFSFFWIMGEIRRHTEIATVNIEPLLNKTPSFATIPKASLLPTLFYSDGHADIPADQERFRVTSKKLSNALLMTVPVARLSVKVVGLLCDKDGQAGQREISFCLSGGVDTDAEFSSKEGLQSPVLRFNFDPVKNSQP